MSRQQSRSSGDGAIDPSLVQKKRARHRLVGAICLCLIAAVIVPMVLESEPRPRDRELPIEMAAPDRHPGETAPATGAAAEHGAGPAAAQSAVKTVVPPAAAPGAPPPLARQDAKQAAAGDAAKADPWKGEVLKADATKADASRSDVARADVARADAARADVARADAARADAAKHSAKAAAGQGDTAKPPLAQDKPPGRSEEPDVLARLIDRTDPAGAAAGAGAGAGATKAAPRKFLVQVGAYSNVQSARTVSDRVVQVGLRPYQETVKTAQGDWIRVRVGPFTSREDAERAQQDLKRAGVTAAIIAL